MKRVSFNTAKAIKDAGYPQYGHCEEFYDSHGNVVDKMCDMHKLVYPRPTYFEIWLWLWREKDIQIVIGEGTCVIRQHGFIQHHFAHSDPEEAIIAAIEYLVDNKLL